MAPEGRKSGLAKAAGAEPAGQMRDEKLLADARRCGAKHMSKSKCTKHTIVGPFLEVEMSKKVHAVVARITFRSQNVQNTPLSDHFWKLRCRKSARHCGAKHISKSKCTKHHMSAPLLEVQMSKKCMPLWREAHFEVKMHKTPHVRATFGGSSSDVEKVHAVVAQSTFRSQHVKNTRGSDHFWAFRCRFAWQARGIVQLVTSEQNEGVLSIFNYNHHYTHYTTTTTTPSLQFHNTTLHSITFNYTTLPYITLHYITTHYITLHYTTLPSTTLHYITLHYTTLHHTTPTTTQLHYTTFHYTPYTTLHHTTLH